MEMNEQVWSVATRQHPACCGWLSLTRPCHAAMASRVVSLPPLLRPDRMTLGVECGENSVAIGAFALCWSERANIVLHPGVCRPGQTHAGPNRGIVDEKGV